MRPFVVVVMAPCSDEMFGQRQGCKPMHVEAFIAKPSVEAFDESVLHRFAGFDVLHFDILLSGPLHEMQACKLGPVITDKRFGLLSSMRECIFERARHARRRERACHFERHALSGVFIDHRQQSNTVAV